MIPTSLTILLRRRHPSPMGTIIPDLILADQDWFKFEVPPGDAGKVLAVRLRATSFPNGSAVADPNNAKDLDYGIMDATGKLLHYSISGDVDELSFIPDIQPGLYYIAHILMPNPGMVYSLYVTTTSDLPVSTISGQVTERGTANGIGGVTVELYGLPFDWNKSRPMAITDASGNYKIAWYSGDHQENFQVQVHVRDWNQNPTDSYWDDWLPVRNFLPNSYDYNKTVTLDPATPIVGANVQLEPGGTISGRITNWQGNPLDQAIAYAFSGNGGQASFAYTDADGNYAIRRLRTGNYAVWFRPRTGIALAGVWFDDRNSFAASLPVAVTAGAITAGIDAVVEDGGNVSGRVTDPGENPIQGVLVTVFDVSGISMQSATTQADGTYLINRIPGGSVKLFFNATPCNSGNYLSEWYSDKGSLAEADAIMVNIGQTTTLPDAVLAAGGAISGRLSDSDNRGLLSGYVQAFDTVSGRAYGRQPFFDGGYAIKNLPAGNYKVRFSYTYGWITNYPAVWYPDVNHSEMASLVPVVVGETTSGIDGVLRDRGNTGGISGRVTDLSGATGIAGLTVAAIESTFSANFNQALTDANGNYTIMNVPAGQAKIFFNADLTWSPYTSEYFNDKTDISTADLVYVTQGVIEPNKDAMLAARPALTIGTTSLPSGEAAIGYSQALAASGGRTLYHWTVTGGALPPGLAMNSRGEIFGTPTTAGTFAFTVLVTDSTTPQQSTTQELSITVGEYTGAGYTISGLVTSGGSPLAGVVLSGLPGSPTTNASGGYIAVVPSGWGGTVTPVRSGYAFTPASITYANVSADSAGQDFAATAGYLISGTVRLDGVGQAMVLMAGLPGTPWTDAAGGYAMTVPAGSTVTVTPTLPGFTFTLPSMTYTAIAADQTGQDYVSTYAGGVDDPFEPNDSFATAREIPMGTTSGLVLRDEDWFKVLVPAGDAGKVLRVRLWGTAFPDMMSGRDLDFGILDGSGKLLSYSLSGSADETAYICDVAAGWYYIAHDYVGLEGTVYSLTIDTNNDFGLAYVSGTVRDDGGLAIPGATVELYGVPFIWNNSRPLVISDSLGHYKIGYTPGPYTVQFNVTDFRDAYDWTPEVNYLGEAYHSGEVLTLAAGATLTGIDGHLTPGGLISGRITDGSGNPLLAARAYAYAGDLTSAAWADTDSNGNYVMDRLRQGNYAVSMRDLGGAQLARIWYDGATSFAAAMPVPVVAGATTAEINGVLGAAGAIAGQVMNEQAEPIVNVQVTAYDPAGIAMQSGYTNSEGHYNVGRLPAGTFKVQFNAGPATSGNYVTEFHPDKRFLAEAEAVGVVVGETTSLNAVLAAAGAITGTVTDGDGHALASASAFAFSTDGSYYLSATTDMSGVYRIRNLPPDAYKVRFRPSYEDLTVEWHDNKAGFATADLVTVAAGATVSGINGDLVAGGALITGTVTNGLSAPIAGLTVVAQDAAIPSAFYSALTDANGNYALRRMPTGQAKVWFNADAAYLNYVSEYHSDKADHASADPVNVTVGETPPVVNAVLANRPALTVTTASLPAGQLGVPYSATLAGSGGRTLYRWSIESGSLPDGLTFTPRGEIGGIATMVGTYPVVVRLTDSTSPQQITTKELSITVGEYTGVGYTISGQILFGGNPLPGVLSERAPREPDDQQRRQICDGRSGWLGGDGDADARGVRFRSHGSAVFARFFEP